MVTGILSMALKPCRVIIAGAGLAGLTLALTLEKIGVDYVLLEAYSDIVTRAGAGICLLPNALRILDQLGCYEDLVSRVKQGVEDINIRKPDGESMKPSSGWWKFHIQRFVLPSISFIARHTPFMFPFCPTSILDPCLTKDIHIFNLGTDTDFIGVIELQSWKSSMIISRTSRRSYRRKELKQFNMLLIQSA